MQYKCHLLVSLLIALSVTGLALADPGPDGTSDFTEADAVKLITEKLADNRKIEPIIKDQVERMSKGEKPPFAGGVDVMEMIENQARTFDKGNIASEMTNIFLSAHGADGGSCVQTKPIPELWCKKCIVRVFGTCLAYLLPPANYGGRVVQATETAPNAYQSGYTYKGLQKVSKDLKYGDLPIVGAASSLAMDAIGDLVLKQEWIQTQLLFAGQSVIFGKPSGDLRTNLIDGITKMAQDKGITKQARKMPTEVKGAFTTDSKGAFKEYAYTEVPLVFPRMMYEVIKKANIQKQTYAILVWPGGIQPIPWSQPLIFHKNKPPFEPWIDYQGLNYLGDMAAAGGVAANRAQERGMLAQSNPLGDSASDVGGLDGILDMVNDLPLDTNLDAPSDTTNLGTVTAGGRPKRLLRGNGLNPILDSFGSEIVTPPGFPVEIGSMLLSSFGPMSFLKPQVGNIIPAVMKQFKQPYLCEGINIQDKFGALNFDKPEINLILDVMSSANPLFGSQFAGQFGKVQGYSKINPCMKHGLGQAVPMTTKTASNKLVSTVSKATSVDTLHVAKLTSVSDATTGRAQSTNFYNKDFDIEQVKKGDKPRDELKDVVQPLPLKLDSRGLGKGFFQAPQGCMHPQQKEATYLDLATGFPLDESDVMAHWKMFKQCDVGSPLTSEDRIFGMPIVDIINEAARQIGLSFSIKNWEPVYD